MKIYGAREDLPVEKIGNGVFRIDEFGTANCYLIVGNEKAMLIDCGTGFCDMRGAVRKITSKPLIVVATHGHLDHIGGKGQFEEIYIPKKDVRPINNLMYSVPMRRLFLSVNAPLKVQGFKRKDVLKPEFKTKTITFDGSTTFDLGGKIITVKETPGHTLGSVSLVDETDKIVFSGDNVCDALWLMLPGNTSLEEWLPSAEWLYDISLTHDVYWGHRTPKLESDYIAEIIGWGKEILKNTKRKSLFYGVKQYPSRKDGIIYRTDKVFKK